MKLRLQIAAAIALASLAASAADGEELRESAVTVSRQSRSERIVECLRLRDFDHGLAPGKVFRVKGVLMHVLDPDHTDPRACALLNSPDGAFFARLPGKPARWWRLVDAELELKGAPAKLLSSGRFGNSFVFDVDDPADVRVCAYPPIDPFAAPEMPIEELHALQSGRAPGDHAVMVRGVVTYCDPGYFFILQDGDNAVQVDIARGTPPVNHGDLMETVGFPQSSDGRNFLWAVVYRAIERDLPLPAPLDLGENPGAQLVTGGSSLPAFAFRRVRVRGRYAGEESSRGGYTTLRLAFEDSTATVTFPGPLDVKTRKLLRFAPILEVTGVAKIESDRGMPYEKTRIPRLMRLEVLATSAADVTVVGDHGLEGRIRASRMKNGTVALAIAAIAALAALLEHSRRQRRLLTAIVAERKRMAGDLHDTIEQHLAGAGMLLKLARSPANRPSDGARGAISEAEDILVQAKREMRDVIWGLQNDELMRTTPERMLRSEAARMAKEGTLRIRTFFNGLPRKLDGAVMRDLSLIVREAVANAVKHGGARLVTIIAEPFGKGGFALSVANDGKPFDPASAPGAAEGHFGLAGMSERAKRIGMKVSVFTRGRWTVVRLEGRG